MKELRLLARSIFVVTENMIRVQIVPEQVTEPDYEAALKALKSIM